MEICHVEENFKLDAESMPPAVQQLLAKYEAIFTDPQVLPPHRKFDHQIPLLPGTKPVNVKSYRYAPHQKTEIEKQVSDMLSRGIIQDSTSPFASPVLLVRKKDGTWRFCVDYRGLNAVTVKNKYPMPIVDELLDELSGSPSSTFALAIIKSGLFPVTNIKPPSEHIRVYMNSK